MKNYIFDLDMTLLDSSHLYHLRQMKNWSEVMNRLNEVVPFQTDDGHVHDYVSMLRSQGKKIGIVTSSPRNYSENLLKMYNIPFDYLVSGTEVTNFKPDPEGLNLCIAGLAASKGETVYIGDDVNDFIASHRAGIISVGCSWGHPLGTSRDMLSKGPDVFLKNPKYLLKDLSHCGFLGEVKAAGSPLQYHKGSLIKFSDGAIRFRCLGRYFSSAHSRRTNPFTVAINKFKDDDSNRAIFLDSITHWLTPASGWKPDLILTVPAKPGQQDRFTKLRAELAAHCNCEDGRTEFLSCTRVVADYKKKSFAERRATNEGLYEVLKDVSGRRILLIDDVITSGSTMTGIAKKLLDKGASDVRCLGLGLNQLDVFDNKVCPVCNGKLKLINGRRGAFWGCENYWPSKACVYSRSCD